MEYILGIGAVLVGAIVILWRKLQGSKVETMLAETKGKDSILKVNQSDIENSIKDLDAGIDEMNKKRKENQKAQEHITMKQREDRWNK